MKTINLTEDEQGFLAGLIEADSRPTVSVDAEAFIARLYRLCTESEPTE